LLSPDLVKKLNIEQIEVQIEEKKVDQERGGGLKSFDNLDDSDSLRIN